ncbi:MAG TPA: hypothetical protein VGA45_18525, partial [Actinomycetota bacterium]
VVAVEPLPLDDELQAAPTKMIPQSVASTAIRRGCIAASKSLIRVDVKPKTCRDGNRFPKDSSPGSAAAAEPYQFRLFDANQFSIS